MGKFFINNRDMEVIVMQNNTEFSLSICEKYMLTIREADVYFNIGTKRMRRFVKSNDGEFSSIR